MCAVTGSSVVMPCSFTHPPGLTVTEVYWITNASHGGETTDLRNRPQYEGRVQYSADKEKNCTMTLSDVRVTDRALYYARIETSTAGQRWQSHQRITFTVKDPPKNTSVSVSPAGEILEGSSVILTCSSDANPPVQSYTWYRRRGGAASVVKSQQIYSMTNITSEHSGLYYCMAENQHGSRNSTEVHLDVQYAPKYVSISASPSGHLIENSTMTLSCSSDANPPVQSYTWHKMNESAVSKAAAHQNYSISAVSSEHSGDYYCQAQNKHGNRNSTVIHISVLYSPKRTSVTLEDKLENSLVTLTCSSDANPPVETYSWYRRTGDKTTEVGSGQIYSFTLTPATAGLYHCQANNRLGSQNSAPVEISLTGDLPVALVAGGGASVLMVITVLLAVFIYRRKRTIGPSSDATQTSRASQVNTQGAVTTSDPTQAADTGDADDVQYASVHFKSCRGQDTALYATAQKPNPSRQQQMEDVEYAAVSFARPIPAASTKVDTELYSTVNKSRKAKA
ncbi:hypothetical protein ACEWY4_017320 [Coilia grayii]|uniref:Ig-like domain-containing protein n=1 Tax=Coilia grayii TaxID=363190 RepID=A0ABD1JGH8_9TELE